MSELVWRFIYEWFTFNACKWGKSLYRGKLFFRSPGATIEGLDCNFVFSIQASSRGIRLDVGVDRLELTTRPPLFQLDLDLPYTLDPHNAGAQFNKTSKLLTLTLPVTGKALY